MNNLDLKIKKWKEFTFEDIFDISSTLSGIDKNRLLKKNGDIPYITRSEKKNGYDSFVGEQESGYEVNKSNLITIGLDTQTVFYQPSGFYTGQNIQILENKNLNKFIAGFFIPSIKRQMKKFSWGGNGATLTRLKRSRLFLPTDTQGEPDYEFMEQYMRQQESEKILEYERFIKERFEVLQDTKTTVSLKEKEWGEFEIGKLFEISQGKSKGLNHLKKVEEGINYLGATNNNNGVLCQVERKQKLIHKGNAIVFIRNGEGSMGFSIYKSEDFIATSDISVGYNKNLNRYSSLFITTLADTVRGKYNFGYKRSLSRLKKEKIMLPIKLNLEPDYEFMENYIKNIEFKKLNEYLDFKKG